MDYDQAANQTVEFLRSAVDVGVGEPAGVTANAIWDAIRRGLKRPAQVEAIEDVQWAPNREENWETLRDLIAQSLKEDKAFRNELLALVAKIPPPAVLPPVGDVAEPGSTVAQADNGSNVNIQE